MSVAEIRDWRRADCGDRCLPYRHDPDDHYAAGIAHAEAAIRRSVVRTGPLIVDLRQELIWVDGREVSLTWREWQMLAYLAERVGQACPVAQIRRAIWDEPHDPQQFFTVMSRLRRKLGPAARLIAAPSRGSAFRATRRLDIEEPTP